MSLNIESIGKQMINAAKSVVGDKWPMTKNYFEAESKAYASRLSTIVELHVNGLISEERAKQHVAFQSNSWETVLLAVEGLNQLMVEEALNAAIKIIRDSVNEAIGFVLLA
jgi:hypothetical protein